MKNKRFRFLSLLLAAMLLLNGLVLAGPAAQAADSVPDGYIGIWSAEDLSAVRSKPSANYILMKDLDLSQSVWTPLPEFSGVFDGNGHTITGMRVSNPGTDAGLFAATRNAVIRNLNMKSVSVTSTVHHAGAICGTMYGGSISGCTVAGSVTGSLAVNENTVEDYGTVCVGGIVGKIKASNNVLIESCVVSGSVTGKLGGDRCFSNDEVYIEYYVGGIAGKVEKGKNNQILACGVSGKIYGQTTAGGIVGYAGAGLTIRESYNAADVTSDAVYWNEDDNWGWGYSYAGGIVGDGGATITDCYNAGSIKNEIDDIAFGISGGNSNVVRCINFGAADYVGGAETSSKVFYREGSLRTPVDYVDYDEKYGPISVSSGAIGSESAYPGLDFTSVWFIDAKSGISHPQLQKCPEAKIDAVQFNTAGAKLTYLQHDKLDVSGMSVSVRYQNGKTSTVPVTAKMVQGFSSEAVGTITVTVSYLGRSIDVQLRIDPIPVSGVSFASESVTIPEKQTFAMQATVSPANATDPTLVWASDDEAVAKVNGNGVITAVSKGVAVITATSKNGKTAYCTVTVTRPATKLTLNRNTLTKYKGETEQLKATPTPSDTTDSVSWKTSDSRVVSVDQNGLLTAVGKGSAVITATAGSGVSATCTVAVKVHAESVKPEQSAVTLDVGETFQMKAAAAPAESDDAISWTSADPAVASITAAGLVTAKAPGTAKLTVATENGKKATCTVTVLQPAKTVKLSRTTLNLFRGEASALQATLSPANTTDSVIWSSSDEKIAAVDKTGKVTAVGKGSATVTAATERGVFASCTVTVQVKAAEVALSETQKTLNVGDFWLLKAAVLPEESDDTITWTSSDPKIATVSSAGRITAISKGTVKIVAKATTGKTAVCTVTVLLPALQITLDRSDLTLNAGETQTLTAALQPADSTDKVTWASSDPTVATVSAAGKITAKGPGRALVTATSDSGKIALCKLTVFAPVKTIKLNQTAASVNVGKTLTLTAAVTPENTTDSLTWKSSNPKVASVSENGVVTAVSKGAATITVRASSGKAASCAIQVLVPSESVSLDVQTAKLDLNEKLTLAAVMQPGNTTDALSWSSDHPEVAVVSPEGEIKAVGVGSAKITVKTTSGKKAVCTVTVKKYAQILVLEQEAITLNRGEKSALQLTVLPTDTTDKVTWNSDNEAVVKVDKTGKITAVGKGSATVTAETERGLKKSCLVTVRVHTAAVSLDQTAVTLNVGEARLLSAVSEPADTDDTISWSSADPAVAAVTDAGRVTAKAPGKTTVTVTSANGKKASCAVTVLQPAKSVSFAEKAVSVKAGEKKRLALSLTPANATDRIAWSSSDVSVAEVSADGTVTAKAAGTAVVTAVAENGKKATCTVTVFIPTRKIALDRAKATLNKGETLALTPALTPANTTDGVTWTSDNPAVAAVSENGTVTAKEKGTATITATTDSGKKATCKITVVIHAASVSLDEQSFTLGLEETKQLSAAVLPADTTDTLKWSSSKPAVATVTPEGVITAVAPGTAVITAKASGGEKATCTVKVIRRAESVTLDRTEARITTLGDSVTLTASLLPENATQKKLVWTSSDETVAVVSASGKVTALAEGEATITVTNEEGLRSASCKVSVVSALAGDVDGNGEITAADARLCLRRAVGLETYPETSREYVACDVDGVAGVSAADARLILRAAVGLEKLKSASHYHVYGEAKRTEPTCAKAGSIVKTCLICGEKNVKELKALGHHFEKADGAKEPVCTVCGKTQ